MSRRTRGTPVLSASCGRPERERTSISGSELDLEIVRPVRCVGRLPIRKSLSEPSVAELPVPAPSGQRRLQFCSEKAEQTGGPDRRVTQRRRSLESRPSFGARSVRRLSRRNSLDAVKNRGTAENLAAFLPNRLRHARVQASTDPVSPRSLLAPGPAGTRAGKITGAVLLLDISGFTSLCERHAGDGTAGCEAFAFAVSDYFVNLVEVIDTHGGDIEGFAGDALVTLFSGSSSRIRHLRKAVHRVSE